MDLETFRNTRQRVDNIGRAIACDYCDAPGYVYTDDLYIRDNDDGTFTLQLCRDEWTMPAHLIGDLEAMLYQWAVGEDFFDDMSRAQIVGTTAAAKIAAWCRDNGRGQEMNLAFIANASRANAAVCHLQDVCDINAFIAAEMFDDESVNDLDGTEYEIARAELMLEPWRLYAEAR